MTHAIKDDRTKAQIIADAEAADKKHGAMLNRQIDSINRLLEAQEMGPVKRYELELMTLNEQVALADIRREAYERILRKIRQSCKDRLNTSILTDVMAQKFLTLIEEVMPSERPDNVDEGRPEEGPGVAEETP